MTTPSFTKHTIGQLDNNIGPAPMNTFFTVGDINADGRPDIVVCGRDGQMAWFQNPGSATTPWQRHIIADVTCQECGGLVHDLTGSGFPDIINGGDWRSDELAWWENPGPRGGTWKRHLIAKTGHGQFHDELIGDVTGDGRLSLVFWNQGSATLYCVPLPADPRLSPWPGITAIATGLREGKQPEEGLAIADIDCDGRNEIIAGQHWFKHTGRADSGWEVHRFARGYITTLIAIGDINADGRPEIVLSEGDACIYGKPQGGKLAWFSPGPDIRDLWHEHVIDDHLLDPHSLLLADTTGSRHLDIIVGEIGVKERYAQDPPRLMVYQNDGQARFTRHIIDQGTGLHHARLADFDGRGVLDIASRPLHGAERWDVHVYRNNGRPARR